MDNSEIKDLVFREAVESIDAGNMKILKQLVSEHPRLLSEPLDFPNGGYFKNPYLIWFIADNPIRIQKLPDNVVEITAYLLDELKKHRVENYNHQINYILGLVATGRIPKESGKQIELIDLLISAGAVPGGGLGALAHGNIDAAKHLIKRGDKLTLPAAVGFKWEDDVMHLVRDASADEKQLALLVASFYGNAKMIKLLLDNGAEVNRMPIHFHGFHSHASPLHQAVYSASLESVKLLVEAGADLSATDRVYSGTPLGWAMYMKAEEAENEESKKQFAAIEEYLKTKQ